MTPRERLRLTFEGKKADRIPVSPFIWCNNIYEMFDYTPTIEDNLFPDPEEFDLATKFIEYNEHFGFDVLHSSGLLWDKYIPPTSENWEVSIEKQGDDDKEVRTTTVNTPDGELKQVMKFSRSSQYLIVFAVQEYLIKTKKDFEILAKYIPPAKFIDCGFIQRAKEAIGDKGLINPASHGVFNTLNQFRKLDDMMIDPINDEGF